MAKTQISVLANQHTVHSGGDSRGGSVINRATRPAKLNQTKPGKPLCFGVVRPEAQGLLYLEADYPGIPQSLLFSCI